MSYESNFDYNGDVSKVDKITFGIMIPELIRSGLFDQPMCPSDGRRERGHVRVRRHGVPVLRQRPDARRNRSGEPSRTRAGPGAYLPIVAHRLPPRRLLDAVVEEVQTRDGRILRRHDEDDDDGARLPRGYVPQCAAGITLSSESRGAARRAPAADDAPRVHLRP
ncbi:hypothetical protein AURANDRAFT_67516 [Aureococcus anophagefferens]|uniref:Uncharacterized protein n=1 Tax=Aureococcus anophagefferens TaxID=44056 RepID=F0YLE8_AURAN|nr:hypothetical protein AURANDRAFT_67516 [Aureococcus anophagefferens]EGB04085.1 hypothetical protein AURANDRAFT_67516 [Aureococcus anophagefferens]|eukprot:XP_009041210.1 hypothetical protein AURANDRAFT_67516 [Aureococcus anophagefferens]